MTSEYGRLETELRAKRDAGRKLLVPYITGGYPGWQDAIRACAANGADAVEIGLPFSDPAVDGPTIQQASVQALNNGITPQGALSELRTRPFGVPLIAMTYFNLVFRYGAERFASDLEAAGCRGSILPDLPFELADEWNEAAMAHGVENVLLAAPVSSDERLAVLAERTGGFLYTVSTMGTTGERDSVDDAAAILAKRIKAISDVPVIVGFGISTPAHAVHAAQTSDGVIVASALMRTLLDGGSIDDVASQIAAMRTALDEEFAR